MTESLTWFMVTLTAFLSSLLSGIAGFGGAMIFLPVLVAVYGARASVPILTVSVLMGNASRVYFNRKELNLKLVGLFSLGSIPFAILGSVLYVSLPALWIKKGIGLFLIVSVIFQRLYKPIQIQNPWIFAPLGGASGFLSALVGGIGPFTAPFFLAFGLTKEAFVGTESLCAVGMHLTKSIAYYQLAVLNRKELGLGLMFGVVMSVASYSAKKALEKLSRERFIILVESLLVMIGLVMLIATPG